MDREYVVCNNCGTKCDANDKFCKGCFSTLSDSFVEPVIEGIEDAELINYIGKNSDYYLEKFAQKKGKWYVQFNWAAFLFGPAWFFYRKMYKVATLYSAALILLSLLFTLVMPIAFRADIDDFFAARGAYLEYSDNYHNSNSGSLVSIYDEPEHKILHGDYKNAAKRIKFINLLITVPVNVINFAFRLFGNAFYKRHVTLNVHNGNNGVSMKNAIFGMIAYNVALTMTSSFLLLIPVVVRFAEATQAIQGWWI